MIRGHRHLKQCAYIGDDSSEELDEIFDGDENNNTSADYDISNKPSNMKTIRDGVILEGKDSEHSDISASRHHHKPFHHGAEEQLQEWDIKKGQVHLNYAEQELNPKKLRDKEEYKTNPKIVNIPSETERQVKSSGEVYDGILQQLKQMGPKGQEMLKQLNKKILEEERNLDSTPKMGISEQKEQISEHKSKETINTNIRNHLKNKKRRRRQISENRETASSLTQHDEHADHAAEEVKYIIQLTLSYLLVGLLTKPSFH